MKAVLLVVLVALMTPLAASSLRGAWRPVDYVLKDDSRLAVNGQIVFTERHWSVLFFVLEGSEPKSGSAEAGTYEVEGDRLTFFHTLRLADLDRGAASALVREIKAPVEEPTRFQIDGDQLTVHFPSGNRMVFRRLDR